MNVRIFLSTLALGIWLLAGFGSPVFAQTTTISQPFGNDEPSGATFIGQTFKATVTGTITSIRVRPTRTSSTTLRFYDAVGPVTNIVGTPNYSQAVSIVFLPGSPDAVAGFQTITLTAPFPVTNGQSYRFSFDDADLSLGSDFFGDPYADGVAFYDGTSYSNYDLAFEVVQVAAPVPVPTLSEWALILFGLMLAGGAALYIQRRRQFV